ncbi:unnamed protein product [Blepharisma stoltei]|uniref:C2H2-type domain-containing protein n=1 Tax=Blepharisma stoltei TaxID=1481888 RepID=A0AAU9JEQ4_9CILI|nr:unnamed protein product [Blepharisma stoltei]
MLYIVAIFNYCTKIYLVRLFIFHINFSDMDGVTCTACRTTLNTQEDCREHYRSDFHTYNLKRKLVSLDPVSKEVFEEKKRESDEIAAELNFNVHCNCCDKTFTSKKSYNKHLEIKKKSHDSRVFQPQSTINDQQTCIFCNFSSESIDGNLKHMMTSHGFFIPDIEFVKDLEGLLKYLQDTVRIGFMCLYCSYDGPSGFKTAQAAQQHMIDKQHCFLNTETKERELRKYYDWGEENSYEVISSEDELRPEHYVDLGSVTSDTSYQSSIISNGMRLPGEITSNGELRLENGKILGNKMWSRYYRQHYRPEQSKMLWIQAVMAEMYKTLAVYNPWRGTDERIQRMQEVQRNLLQQGMRNNNHLHFRDQNL